jgi:hypothetical protein
MRRLGRAPRREAVRRALLAWIASHPSAPGELLAELYGEGGHEVLLSLALNPARPASVRDALLDHPDAEVRAHANHVTCRLRALRPLVTRGAQ